MRSHNRGFTLTELMITLAIVVILGVIAVPSFSRQVQQSNRTDATAALLRVAAEQEKFYLQNNTYGDLDDLGNPTTENGYYTLAITTANATTFTATATAASGGPQIADDNCRVFTITAAGQRSATDEGGDDSTELCW